MRKLLVGAMALAFFAAIAVAGAAERHPSVGVKADGPLEVGSQLRRYGAPIIGRIAATVARYTGPAI